MPCKCDNIDYPANGAYAYCDYCWNTTMKDRQPQRSGDLDTLVDSMGDLIRELRFQYRRPQARLKVTNRLEGPSPYDATNDQ